MAIYIRKNILTFRSLSPDRKKHKGKENTDTDEQRNLYIRCCLSWIHFCRTIFKSAANFQSLFQTAVVVTFQEKWSDFQFCLKIQTKDRNV